MAFDPSLRYRGLPAVALVGRPNVGKSTLFNRLVRRRRAITDPTPGVTRDPVEERAFIAGKPLRLIDTGGFRLERDRRPSASAPGGGDIDSMVLERTVEIIEGADLIVLMLEAGELTAEDEELIALLRPHRGRLITVVNKTEGGRLEGEAWNALRYGFDSLLLISAEHGDRVAELEAAIVSRLDFSAVEAEGGPAGRPIALAIVGKPNTGKSTLSNRLTSSSASIVSPVPGTTRDVVEGAFDRGGRTFRVLDTAGIRRKARVTENIEYYSVNRAVKTLDEADIVLLLVDAAEGLSEQDKKIAALACERGRGIILVLNKWDAAEDKNFAAERDRIRYFFGQMEYAPILPLSALTGRGVDELLDTAVRIYGQLCRRVDTAELNQALARWLEEYPPPQGPRTRFKIRYAFQVEANPVRFVFFASRPAAVTDAYRAYLRNRIRQDLGFSLISVEAEIRPGRRDRRKK